MGNIWNEAQDREDTIVEIEYFAHIEEGAASILAQTDECLDLYGITEFEVVGDRHGPVRPTDSD